MAQKTAPLVPVSPYRAPATGGRFKSDPVPVFSLVVVPRFFMSLRVTAGFSLTDRGPGIEGDLYLDSAYLLVGHGGGSKLTCIRLKKKRLGKIWSGLKTGALLAGRRNLLIQALFTFCTQ